MYANDQLKKLLSFILFLILASCACDDYSSSNQASLLPTYTIAEHHSWRSSGSDYLRIKARVQTNQAPSDQVLLDIGDVIFEKNTGYDHVRIFIYAPGDDIESVAYCRMDYSYGELVESVAIRDASAW